MIGALYLDARGFYRGIKKGIESGAANENVKLRGRNSGGHAFGFPNQAIVVFVLFFPFVFISRKAVFGRGVFAVGGNAGVEDMTSISVFGSRMGIFAVAGFLPASIGVLLASR